MEKNKIIFVLKTYDEVSSVAEYLFIDKQDYFIDSVTEFEIPNKSYALAIQAFKEKNPTYKDSNIYHFVIGNND
jgi:hypothetical protein